MTRNTWILSAALLAAAPLLAVPSAARGGVKVGDNLAWLADQTVTTTTGQEFAFRDLLPAPGESGADAKEGSLFVLSAWAYNCPYSRGWDPELNAIAGEYAARGVKVFGFDSSVNEVSKKEQIERVNEYIRKAGLGFPVLVDRDSKIAGLLGARTTPHVFVVDRKGVVVYTGAIDNDMRQRKPEEERRHWLRDALDAVLAGEEVPVRESRPQGCSIKWFPKQVEG